MILSGSSPQTFMKASTWRLRSREAITVMFESTSSILFRNLRLPSSLSASQRMHIEYIGNEKDLFQDEVPRLLSLLRIRCNLT